MDTIAILQHLRKLDTAHWNDGDGGCALVRAIKDWAALLEPRDRETLWSVLIDLVAQKDSTLWGAALEALVQEHPGEAATKLSYLVDLSGRSEEWTDQIILALLCLGYQPSAAYCVSYIRAALENGRRAVLPLLAALCRVDVEACLSLSAAYFEGLFKSGDLAEKHRGYIPAFVRNFLEVDEGLLRELVERMKKVDPASSSKMAAMIDDCLAQPWFTREIGESKVTALRRAILAVFDR
jgi:hypothetical protein